MKPRVVFNPIDKYRQWTVYTANSATYFPNHQAALNYVMSLAKPVSKK